MTVPFRASWPRADDRHEIRDRAVVRATGGLADTVFDRDYSSRPVEARTGYVFHHANYIALDSALWRALGLWYVYPDEFRKLIINGMRYDYSWNNPGHHYLNIYHHIRHK